MKYCIYILNCRFFKVIFFLKLTRIENQNVNLVPKCKLILCTSLVKQNMSYKISNHSEKKRKLNKMVCKISK